jgi:hypothetical protein
VCSYRMGNIEHARLLYDPIKRFYQYAKGPIKDVV